MLRMSSHIDILGVRVDDVTFAELLGAVSRFVEGGGTHRIATINTEYLVAAQRDLDFADSLRHTDLNVPDSYGVLWAARWLGHTLRERVTGSDGIDRIAELCAQRGFRLFLLGAAPGVAQRTAAILVERYPGLTVCGTYAGSPSVQEQDEIARRIREAQTDVLLVAYSQCPQEKWIARNQEKTGAPVAMGVGAAFDFVAGVQKRAPLWMQRLGSEWLYRLFCQPWRWRRMLVLPQAAWLVFWQRLGKQRPGETR
jgi:N-acetylglucosaminyldiphosphoundecaprenol N-acetyl-beta-D-mannosaminyltransferase